MNGSENKKIAETNSSSNCSAILVMNIYVICSDFLLIAH